MFKYTALLCFWLLLSPAAFADTLAGRVVAVKDGDTIAVLNADNEQFDIRLAGIDTPEKKQPFGQVAKQSLSELIYDKQVLVDCNKKDRYGRIVGKVLLNRTDVNLEQLRLGLAWHYKKYQKEQTFEDRLTYAQVELEARRLKRGLWVDAEPLPPWDWRTAKRQAKK